MFYLHRIWMAPLNPELSGTEWKLAIPSGNCCCDHCLNSGGECAFHFWSSSKAPAFLFLPGLAPLIFFSLSLFLSFFTPTEISFDNLWDDTTRVGALFESPPSTESWGFGREAEYRVLEAWTEPGDWSVLPHRLGQWEGLIPGSNVIWVWSFDLGQVLIGWQDVHGQVDAGWRERARAYS